MKPKLLEFVDGLTSWYADEQLDFSIRPYRARGMKEGVTALFLTKSELLEDFIKLAAEGGNMVNAMLECVAQRDNPNFSVDPQDEILRFDEFGKDGIIVY